MKKDDVSYIVFFQICPDLLLDRECSMNVPMEVVIPYRAPAIGKKIKHNIYDIDLVVPRVPYEDSLV